MTYHFNVRVFFLIHDVCKMYGVRWIIRKYDKASRPAMISAIVDTF